MSDNKTKPVATPADQPKPEAENAKPTRNLRQAGKPKFNEDDVCQYNGALVVVIGRAKEIVAEGNAAADAEGDAEALVWRYLVNLPDAAGRCPYLISAGSWAPESKLKSIEQCQSDLNDSVSTLRL